MEERLSRLERENRRMKQAGVVALAVIAAVVLMGQATQGKVAKVIEAEKFVVRIPDSANAMATLDFAGLTLYDWDGKGVAFLNTLDGGPNLSLHGTPTGHPRISLTGEKGIKKVELTHRGSFISMEIGHEDPQKHGITLWVDDVSAWLNVRDEKSGSATLSIHTPVGPTLTLSDAKRKERVRLSLFEDKPTLRLYDKKGKLRAVLGSTSLKITRPGMAGGKVETEEKRPESSLVLFDKAGKLIWSAPGQQAAGTSRLWVLWVVDVEGRLQPVAVTTWPTQTQCEQDKLAKQQPAGQEGGVGVVCLPEGIHPHGRR